MDTDVATQRDGGLKRGDLLTKTEGEFRERVFKETGVSFVGVYVIASADERPCKVGMTDNPWERVIELQVGNPYPLHVHRVFWIEGRSEAAAVEKDAHGLIAERNRRLSGEWFDILACDAADMVEMAALKNGVQAHRNMPSVAGLVSPGDDFDKWLEARSAKRERVRKIQLSFPKVASLTDNPERYKKARE
jgi:hypothetical protein